MRERLAPAAALFLVLLTAVALRFHGLAWGLRHAPIDDERYFVDNVARMLAERSLDHRFYEYPGLLFYVLLPFQALAGGSGPPATYAARAVIAAFGVLSVALTFALARRLLGSAPAALTAAALVAVSPLEVVTAHTLRPDVALEAFALLTLLALARLDGAWRADARAGAALALAISTKFTGVLLLPSFLAARACWARLARGLLVAGGVALALGVLFTPYAWLDPQAFLRGARYQVGFHYVGRVEHGYLDNVAFYLGSLARGLGWPAARRLLRELGSRLASGGLLDVADDVFWLTREEADRAASAWDAGRPVGPSASVAVTRTWLVRRPGARTSACTSISEAASASPGAMGAINRAYGIQSPPMKTTTTPCTSAW